MIELKNITLEQYAALEDKSEYDFMMKWAFMFNKPVDHFNIGVFDEHPFGLVKDIQQDMVEGIKWDKMLDYISQLSKKSIKELQKTSLLELCQVKNYVVSEIQRLVEIEGQVLVYESTEEEKRAGIETFAVFGVYSQLLSLAGGDPIKIPDARKMKYVDAFVYLVYEKTKNDFERNLIAIRNKSK